MRESLVDLNKLSLETLSNLAQSELRLICSHSGVRGRFGRDASLSEEAKVVALVYGYLYTISTISRWSKFNPDKNRFRFVIGKDPRPTSQQIQQAHIISMLFAGETKGVEVEVIDLDVITTPILESSVRTFKADGGIMITASHNPLEYNGFKCMTGYEEPEKDSLNCNGSILNAQKMGDLVDESQMLLKEIAGGNIEFLEKTSSFYSENIENIAEIKQKEKVSANHTEAIRGYTEFVKELFSISDEYLKRIKNRNPLVIVDPNGGSACGISTEVLTHFGSDTIEINNQPGKPNHTIEPIDEALTGLMQEVKEKDADLGVVFDFDADRGNIVIKDQGQVKKLHPQEVACLNVANMLSYISSNIPFFPQAQNRRWAIVVHGATSFRNFKLAEKFNVEVVEVETGEVNVVTKMHELEKRGYFVPAGIEGYNGGTVLFGSEVRDGTLVALLSSFVLSDIKLFNSLRQAMGYKEQRGTYTLSCVLNSLPKFYTLQHNLEGRPISQTQIKSKLEEEFKKRIIPSATKFKLKGLGEREFLSYEFLNYEGTKVVKRRTGDETGGFKIVLLDTENRRHFMWFRGSRTQLGLFRTCVDSPDEDLANQLYLLQEEIYQQATSKSTLPILLPATEDYLVRWLGESSAMDILKKGIEVPKRGEGKVVAEGTIQIVDFRLKIDDCSDTEELGIKRCKDCIEDGLRFLDSKRDVDVVKDCIWELKEKNSIPVKLLKEHERIMELTQPSPLEPSTSPTLLFDIDIHQSPLTSHHSPVTTHQSPLTTLYALGLLHEFYHLLGLNEEDALLRTLEFYEALSIEESEQLCELLSGKWIDSGDNFLKFLLSAGKSISEKKLAIAYLRKTELADLAYSDREIANQVMGPDGRPKLKELGLTELRETVHNTLTKTFSPELEKQNIERISDYAQEEGIELVLGFLGRAGLIEQLLMASASYLPTSELRECVGKLIEEYQKVPLEVKTEELADSAAKWKQVGAFLQAINNLISSEELPQASIVGAVRDFTNALRDFESEFSRKADELRIRENGQKGEAKEQEYLKSDLALIKEKVDEFITRAIEINSILANLPKSEAVMNIIYQRFAPRETLNMFLLNRLLDPYLGETEDIKRLLREGGHALHVTGSIEPALLKVNHWIQALPAYAYYKIEDKPSGDYRIIAGCERDILEMAYKNYAQQWAQNIEEVMRLEHASLAREFLAEMLGDDFKEEVDSALSKFPSLDTEEAIRNLMIEKDLTEEVAAIATLIDATYWKLPEEVAKYTTEKTSRMDALRKVIRSYQGKENLIKDIESPQLAFVLIEENNLQDTFEHYNQQPSGGGKKATSNRPFALKRRKPLPSAHTLTTLGPGETRVYMRNWFEESMGLYLFCREYNLENKVNEKLEEYSFLIASVAKKLIWELDLQGELYEEMAEEGKDPSNDEELNRAAARFIRKYPQVSVEVARICTIAEYEKAEGQRGKGAKGQPECLNWHSGKRAKGQISNQSGNSQSEDLEPESVLKYIERHSRELENKALETMVEAYDLDYRVEKYQRIHRTSRKKAIREVFNSLSEDNSLLQGEMKSIIRSAARKAVVQQLDLEYEAKEYIRQHTTLAKFNARKEVAFEEIKSRNLNPDLLNDPKFRYEATGAYKKYHLLYTPSRVDLGSGEVESVVYQRKVVSADDYQSLKRGSALHRLYNQAGVAEFPATVHGEFFKTAENFFTRGGNFYLSLGEGINIDALMMGDFEDYMWYSNLRGDRIQLPTGETYGGFCVPKEFFLMYAVMIASTEIDVAEDILRGFGIDKALIRTSYEVGEQLKIKRGSFLDDLQTALNIEAEDILEWERKAREFFCGKYEDYFEVMTHPVFISRLPQLTKSLENWGIVMSEEDKRSRELLYRMTSWANKKMQGLEQINRAGPYRKIELMSSLAKEAINQSALTGTLAKGQKVKSIKELKVMMSMPYKEGAVTEKGEERPITDARFAAGPRKLIIFSGEDWCLTKDLDPEGRKVIQSLKESFISPVDIIAAGTVSASDVLNAVPDASLQKVIDEVRRKLTELGLDDEQISANCKTYGAELSKWSILSEPKTELRLERKRRALLNDEQFQKKVHLLVLQERDVEASYDVAVSGCDIIDLGIPDPGLLDLVDNLPKLVALARKRAKGRRAPHGILVITDGTSGARRRTFSCRNFSTKEKVKELFAIDPLALYGCLGLGQKEIETWRSEMEKEREQAKNLYDALIEDQREQAFAVYDEIVRDVRLLRLAEKATNAEIRAKKTGRWSKKLSLESLALGNIKAGLPLSKLDFGTWLIIGGRYLLNGKIDCQRFKETRAKFEEAISKLPSCSLPSNVHPMTSSEIDEIGKQLFRPKYEFELVKEFEEKSTGRVTVGKVLGERTAVLGKWALRRQKTRLQNLLNERKKAKRESAAKVEEFSELYQRAKQCIGKPTQTVSQSQFGEFLSFTSAACLKVLYSVIPKDSPFRKQVEDRITLHLSGEAISAERHSAIVEDFTKLIDIESERLQKEGFNQKNAEVTNLENIVKAEELLSEVLAISFSFDVDLADESQKEWVALRSLMNFFDKTINAHMFDYFPFLIQPSLSPGSFDRWYSREEKFEVCRERGWLYTYLRNFLIENTRLKDYSSDYHQKWLGDIDRGILGLGVGGETPAQKFWYSFARLRDAAVLMHEGYELPEIFWNIDPSILEADGEFTNLVSVYPHGNTTMPVALEQGAWFQKRQYNLFLCAFPYIAEEQGQNGNNLYASDAFMYISPERYRELLVASGVDSHLAERMAKKVPPKGLLAAIKFTSPVVAHGVFFHFTNELRPTIEKIDAPVIQPLAWEAATYLKCELPDILSPSYVCTPFQTNWMKDDTQRLFSSGLDADEVRDRIYEKLEEFLDRYYTFGVTELVVKPEKESGGRGAQLLPILSRRKAREGIKSFIESGKDNLLLLVRLIYQISQNDNAAIQGVVHSRVRSLYTAEFLETVVQGLTKQGVSVSLDRPPQTPLFSVFRINLIRGSGEDFKISHKITVLSTAGIANVGQGAVLHEYKDDRINPKYRKIFREEIEKAARESMNSQRRYLRENWPKILEEYLLVHKRFGRVFESRLGEQLQDNLNEILDEFFKYNPKYDSELLTDRVKNFLSEWTGNFLSKRNGKGFSDAVKEEFSRLPSLARDLKIAIGNFLHDTDFINLDIHYEMGDYIPLWLVDEEDNLLYIPERDENGDLLLDDWQNMKLARLAGGKLPVKGRRAPPSEVKLFDEEGNPIPVKDKDGNSLKIAMFDEDGNERKIYDKHGNQIRCLMIVKLEPNPGAGQWRPHDLDLPPERKGEGVKVLFEGLGERALQFKQTLPDSHQSPVTSHQSPKYFGAGPNLRFSLGKALPNTVEERIELAIDKALEDLGQVEDYKFEKDDLSLVLTYFLSSELAHRNNGLENLKKLPSESLKKKISKLLTDPDIRKTLIIMVPTEESTRLKSGVIEELLEMNDYCQAITRITTESILVGEEAIALRIAPYPLSAEKISRKINHACIFNELEILAQDALFSLCDDANKYYEEKGERVSPISILGVHQDWLTSEGKAKKALILDKTGFMKEVTFSEPVKIHTAQVFHLKIEDESKSHEKIANQLEKADIPLINPYEISNSADDKSQTAKLLSKDHVEIPFGLLFHKETTESPESILVCFAKELLEKRDMFDQGIKKISLVIKPNKGTEGILVAGFSLEVSIDKDGELSIIDTEAKKEAVKHIKKISKVDDIRIEELRGNLTFEGKRFSLRLFVSSDGKKFEANTGYVQVSKDESSLISSKSHGGKNRDINEVLFSLQYSGEKFSLTSDTIDRVKKAAIDAASNFKDLLFVGVDLLLEAEEDRDGNIKIVPVVLELNPRPTILPQTSLIAEVKKGKIESEPQVTKTLFSAVEKLNDC